MTAWREADGHVFGVTRDQHTVAMHRVVLATGVQIAVRECGRGGVPVLLLHAWGETHRTFDRLVPLLPETWRLVIPDQRGVGGSDKPADGYELYEARADMVALLDALELDSCWVVGTSSGGYLAQQIALDHPNRVLGMVLLGSPSNLQETSPDVLIDLVSSFHDPVTREDVGRVNGAFRLYKPVPDSFLDDQVSAALSIPKHVWLSTLHGLLRADPPIHSGRITVPTLILWGSQEDVLPPGQGDDLVAAIEASRIVRYDGTGHLVLWEQPERVARDTAAFIADQVSVQ